MNTTPTKLLKIPEAAARLSIKPRTYYRMVQSAQLPPPLKINSRSFVPESVVQEFLARQMQAMQAGFAQRKELARQIYAA